jgi:Na+-transporting NADH:ubiquinone oxidoreductase subunit NqrB
MRSTTSQPAAAHAVITFVIILEALTFFFFGFLHSGIHLSLGFAVLQEPRIIPAMIVESLCGLLLTGSAFSIATRKSWSWIASIVAHTFSIGGVLLGMAALALGAGPRTELNDIYHRTILIILVVILIYLFTPAGKEALGHAQRSGNTS